MLRSPPRPQRGVQEDHRGPGRRRVVRHRRANDPGADNDNIRDRHLLILLVS